MTHITGLISNLILTELKDPGCSGEFTLYLNTYSYILTLDEENMLVSLLDSLIPNFVGIKIIHCNYDEIDPEWTYETEIKTLFMYEALSWLEYQNANTKVLLKPLVNVMLYGPDIVEGNMKDEIITVEFFKNLIIMFGGIINYLPIEVKYLNTVLDIDERKKKVDTVQP